MPIFKSRPHIARRVLDDLSTSQLAKAKHYVFQPSDLADFNKKYDHPRSNATSATASVNQSETGSPYPAFDEEHIRYKYRPEVTIELHDFPCPLETTDLQRLFVAYKRDDNIVRIKWFNRNRAIAWFTSPGLAKQALEDLRTNELVHVKQYHFEASDMRYFNPDSKMADITGSPAGTLSRRRTISGGSGLARRNTVSGASHYNRGKMFAAASAHSNAVPPIPSVFNPSVLAHNGTALAHNINAVANGGSATASPIPPARRLRRFSKPTI
ncbi:hypothetical protein EC988_007489 [Linderina pennispora]|nr:hypothetical protein EC988_007489 [Linderina pennispora]